MITGKVTANRESISELEIIGSNQRKENVEVVIDIAFNCIGYASRKTMLVI